MNRLNKVDRRRIPQCFVKIDDYNMADLSVKISDLHLKNPVMTASGTFGYGLEFADFVPWKRLEESSSRERR